MRQQTFILFFMALLGCGSGAPYAIVPVSGQVTYEDGQLIQASRVSIMFYPQAAAVDAKTHPRPGRAEVDLSTGKFDQATTYDYGDGVIAGRQRVVILALDDQNLPTDAVPQRYASPETTPLEVDTADGPFDLKIERATQ